MIDGTYNKSRQQEAHLETFDPFTALEQETLKRFCSAALLFNEDECLKNKQNSN